MPGTDGLAGDISTGVDKIGAPGGLLDQLRQQGQAVIDQVNGLTHDDTLSPVGEWLAEMIFIGEKAEEMRIKLEEFMAKVAKEIEHGTPVVSMVDTAVEWLQVNKNLGEIHANSTDTVSNLDYWTGPARNAYDKVVEQNNAAFTAVENRATAIGDWLVSIADQNVTFLASVASHVISLLEKLAQVAASVLTLTGVFEILAELVGFIASAIATLSQIALEGAQRQFQEVLTAYSADRINTDSGDLPAGTWPTVIDAA